MPRDEIDASAPPSRIPDFQTRQEETEFWDSHDVTDFLDELRPIEVRFAEQLSHELLVPLDPEEWRALGAMAASQGVGPTTLVRTWIVERLREAAAPR